VLESELEWAKERREPRQVLEEMRKLATSAPPWTPFIDIGVIDSDIEAKQIAAIQKADRETEALCDALLVSKREQGIDREEPFLRTSMNHIKHDSRSTVAHKVLCFLIILLSPSLPLSSPFSSLSLSILLLDFEHHLCLSFSFDRRLWEVEFILSQIKRRVCVPMFRIVIFVSFTR